MKFIETLFQQLNTWGLPVLLLIVGILESMFGLYNKRNDRNEFILDLLSFAIPKVLFPPVLAYFSLKFLPVLLPAWRNMFSWVPFFWGVVIIAVADDLTQYWNHRLHHQVPFLWRFHRTHHSAPYMGVAVYFRNNLIHVLLFSQVYLVATLAYLGLGYPALFVAGMKSLIVAAAHSSIPWDKPMYRIKWLHPVAWVLERFISTPATHHAHHAVTSDDDVGYYKGNFGNMFFIWDIIFGTGLITRKYPEEYGISHYEKDEWYAQFLWPLLKSKAPDSELSAGGPMVRMDDEPAIPAAPAEEAGV
ncbi:MAG TPA: sterol desaturase family protein [Chitinophaga sp.]|uniref:sterol desaturase family protein n=1 Tax=Chitinophaga sp. TaxID=1869181 RepID=UPI002B5683F2|nr:sterol desaturase family protein [Chitinophaga sp.]HVI46115.1 sterol desaturase family protein [Chitinophaga sp.]